MLKFHDSSQISADFKQNVFGRFASGQISTHIDWKKRIHIIQIVMYHSKRHSFGVEIQILCASTKVLRGWNRPTLTERIITSTATGQKNTPGPRTLPLGWKVAPISRVK